MSHTRDITKQEWSEYQWIRVMGNQFVRGIKYTRPPEDGYEYTEVTTFGDSEQKWSRIKEIVDD
jgi:hypothetical protein